MEENFLKLTNTVYKILEFFPESDPLKNRAKDKALAIMDHLTLIDKTKSSPAIRQGWTTLGDVFWEEKIKVHLLEDVDILLGYLWIGKSQGWLNSVNCLIIANEYEKIIKDIKPKNSQLPQKNAVTDENQAYQEYAKIAPQIAPEEHINPVVKDTGTSEKQAPISDRQSPPLHEVTARQRKIIEFLSKREKAQVMEIQTVLPDITKRTIRRDLDELLEMGQIERDGTFNQVVYKIKISY